jgi:hypothetical protein
MAEIMAASYYPSEDLHLNIARGLVKGTSSVHKFGAVPAMSQNQTGTIWDVDDTPYPWDAFAGPGPLTIATTTVNGASSTLDDGVSVTVIGLDENFNETQEDIPIVGSSGTGTVPFIRVYRAFTNVTNQAQIRVSTTQGTPTEILRINIGQSQTLMAIYTVPDGYDAFLMQGTASIQAGGDATIGMYVRYAGQQSFRIGHTAEVAGTGMPYHYNFTCPVKIPATSDIDIRASVRSNNARVTAAFDLVLIKQGLA